MRRTELFRHLQSAVGQINRNDLLHLEVLCSHESSQTNTSHSEDDNTLVEVRFQDVEYCPCASLESAAAGRKDSHILCLARKFHHTGLTYDAQTREATLTKELALQRLAVGFPLRGRGAVAAGTHQVEHAVVAVTRMATGTSFAGPTKAVRQQDWVADLDAFVVDFGTYCSDNASSFVAKDGRRV
jgi:hypothetical protein